MELTIINLLLAIFVFIGLVGISLISYNTFKQHFPKKGDFIKALKGDEVK